MNAKARERAMRVLFSSLLESNLFFWFRSFGVGTRKKRLNKIKRILYPI
jgi:hypothetical protein